MLAELQVNCFNPSIEHMDPALTRNKATPPCRIIGGLLLMIACLWSTGAGALEPAEVLVVVNGSSQPAAGLARLYMQQRAIPATNRVVLAVTDDEVCARKTYERRIAGPVRAYLRTRNPALPKIRCLVLMYGIPLRIAATPQPPSLASLPTGDKPKIDPQAAKARKRQSHLKSDSAAVDSEIALVNANSYPLAGWLPNPYYPGFKNQKLILTREEVLMVSRLDGPDPATVFRIIKDSLQTERKGLTGTAFFDARWPATRDPKENGYTRYDHALHRTAELLQQRGMLPVVMDDTPGLFPAGAALPAALYCGWYSLANYVDAFAWQPGAVGYHIASAELRTLKRAGSRVWCKRMLEEGIAATLGPVSEPYVEAFPMPPIFFGLLTDGYLTLAECYLASTPFFSWKMVLIGDPLYRPFAKLRR